MRLTLDAGRYTSASLFLSKNGALVEAKFELPKGIFNGLSIYDDEAVADLIAQCASLTNNGLKSCDEWCNVYPYKIARLM